MKKILLVPRVLKMIKQKLWNFIKPFSNVKTNNVDCKIFAVFQKTLKFSKTEKKNTCFIDAFLIYNFLKSNQYPITRNLEVFRYDVFSLCIYP